MMIFAYIVALAPYSIMLWCWWVSVEYAETWIQAMLGAAAFGLILVGIFGAADGIDPGQSVRVFLFVFIITAAMRAAQAIAPRFKPSR